MAVHHRRAGKDEVSLHHTACAAHERVGNYVHMLPIYAQARKAIWDSVNAETGRRRIDEAFPEELRKWTREQEMSIGFKNGSTWQLAGSDAYNSLVGTSYVGMVFSEYALSNPAAWGYFSPILMANDGWAIFISTPRGRNHLFDMYRLAQREPGWFAELLTNDDTGVFTEDQMRGELARLQALHGDDYGRAIWAQEYFCSFDAAIPGAIWADCIVRAENDNRITDFEVNRQAPVFTAWDLGRTDDTSIWFYQLLGPRQIDVIDHHSSNLKDIPFYLDLLRRKAAEHGVRYGTHWLPHDARPRTLAAGGKSILQQFTDGVRGDEKAGKFAICKRLDRQEGIQAARATFPLVRLHKTRCEKGIESLRQYHREWDEELQMFKDSPKHDWCLEGNTKIWTRDGMCQIMGLPEAGEVMTSCGWKRYTNPRITRRNAPLVEVTFNDGSTVKCTPDHLFATENGWTFAEHLMPNTPIQSCWTPLRSILMAASIGYGRVIAIYRAAAKNCIEMLGGLRSGQSQMVATFTTRTATQKTTPSPILSALMPVSTHQKTGTSTTAERSTTSQSWLEKARLLGTALRKGAYGTGATWSELRRGQNGSALRSRAGSAERNTWAFRAASKIKNIVRRHVGILHIKSVKGLPETADVWCITVPIVRDYALSNGAIVHNSSHDADSFRVLSLSWRYNAPKEPMEPFADRLLKANPVTQTFGQLKKRFLARKLAEREMRME